MKSKSKPSPSPQDEEIIDLLEKLKPLQAEYPPDLLAARRETFLAQLEQRSAPVVQKENISSQDQLTHLLGVLKPAVTEYPSELLTARRAAFLARIDEHNRQVAPEEVYSEGQVLELLENVKPVHAEYPPDLLAARRAAFLAQIEQRDRASAPEETEALTAAEGGVLTLLQRLKLMEIEYPGRLWRNRRSAFIAQLRDGRTSILDALHRTLQNFLRGKRTFSSQPVVSFRQMSVVVATLLLAVFVTTQLRGTGEFLAGLPDPAASQPGVSQPGAVAATSTGDVAKVICKTGYEPPLCLAKEFDKSRDLTYAGNGSARPAVAKDTIPGYSRVHHAAYVNDGLYGPGASWISNSAYSWIKIDLGETQTINTVTFGRDRLGEFNDGDPGQFIISVALEDDVYADGNSSNDHREYTEVYNSHEMGFDGIISGPETVKASFEPVMARFIKITFEKPRTAVDEVEVFMIQPPGFVASPTQKHRDDPPRPTLTAVPTHTLIPTYTFTAVPTSTPVPTYTVTPVPTNTPLPTNTETPVPTDTTSPPTQTPEPTDTSEPPTDTPAPPSSTPVAPTNTSLPTQITEETLMIVTATPDVVGAP